MRTMRCIAFCAALATACIAITASVDGQKPKWIGAGPHLFLDDVLTAKQSGLVRKVHACEKLPSPVLKPERSWEEDRVYVYGSVFSVPHEDGLRMWYMSRGSDWDNRDERLRIKGADLVLYAVSKDGVDWLRPDLAEYEFGGNRSNNIVFAMHSPSVLYDLADPDPAYRYKMLGHLGEMPGQKQGGYCAAYSSDGIRWKLYPKNPIIPGADTITLSYNRQTGEYMAFYKIRTMFRGYYRRVVMLATSKDMQNWTKHGFVLVPDVEDDRWCERDPQRTEFYNMSVFQRGSHFLGLVTVFRVEEVRDRAEVGHKQSRYDGPIDVQLAHSRDGLNWRRLDEREPVIPRGPREYDAGSILGVSNIPVFHNDRMWVYYTAMTTTHGGAVPEKKMSIARASWRLDGMVSLDAQSEEAVLETVPLEFEGQRLFVNADASGGQLVVELLDWEGNRPLSGYGAADCVSVCSDGVKHEIHWANGSVLPNDRPLRIRFRLRNASLYSFSFTNNGTENCSVTQKLKKDL